jgi:Concanavalin A-like lectin/glucanases superfamily
MKSPAFFRRLSFRCAVLAATAAALAFPVASGAAVSFPLAGYWPLNEGSGQIIHDWSGHGHNGWLGSSTAPDANDPSWIKGIFFGSALRFDGVDDFVQIPNSTDFESQNLTVSLWFRGTGPQPALRYLLAKGGDRCVAASYGLETSWGGGLQFYVWDGRDQHFSADAGIGVWDGKWHNAAATWDGKQAYLFLDGKPIGTTTYVPGPATIDYTDPTGATNLGGYHAGCDLLFAGDIDSVTIWSTVLPVENIWAKFASILGSPTIK